MKPHPLLSRFDLIADTPGNIQHLRKLFIHLAVSGRLLDASSDERSLSELRNGIASKRKALIKAGRIKKVRILPPIDEAELPAGCQDAAGFERLENIAILEKGLTAIQSAEPGAYPLVVTAEDRSSCDHYDFDGTAAVIPMVSSSGHGNASLKRLHYQEGKFALGNILCAAFPVSDEFISARFIFEYLTAFKEDLLVSKMIGTANVSLTLGKIGEIPIPVVSLAVQRRVDELMALCDQLEATQAKREHRRNLLVAACLHSLRNYSDTGVFREHARLYLDHLYRLTSRPKHIKQLRQIILDLAVQGRLVPPGPGDVGDVKSSTESSLSFRSFDVSAYSGDFPSLTLPAHWSVEPLGNIAAAIVDCPHSTPKWTSEGMMCVRTSQFRPGHLDLSDVRFVSESTYLERVRRLIPVENDILYSREGGILGVACRIPAHVQICLGQRMMLIRSSPAVESGFLEMVLNSPLITGIALDETTGGAAPRINVSTVKAYPIPLPTPGEQRRIIAKVDELMALCDRLETQLITTQNHGRHLLEAILSETLATSAPRERSKSTVSSPELQLNSSH